MAEIEAKFEARAAKLFFKNIASNVKGITEQQSKEYMGLVAENLFADVIKHFEVESGPKGKWKAWSPDYRRKEGQILQDTGRLRQHVQIGNIRKIKDGWQLFNDVPYARIHDLGGKMKNGGIMPQRQFMWFSDAGMKKLEKETVAFMLRG